jgi:hypothetical protein
MIIQHMQNFLAVSLKEDSYYLTMLNFGSRKQLNHVGIDFWIWSWPSLGDCLYNFVSFVTVVFIYEVCVKIVVLQ